MLKIGYARLDATDGEADMAALEDAGCQVVRAEAAGGAGHVLGSILGFLGPGDELVVLRLDRLGGSGRSLLFALDRVEACGAALRVLQPDLCSQGHAGRTLRAVLEAVAALEPEPPTGRRRGPAPTDQIHALQRAGMRPVEIARRLGVSRMTVWRKLKALEGEGAGA